MKYLVENVIVRATGRGGRAANSKILLLKLFS